MFVQIALMLWYDTMQRVGAKSWRCGTLSLYTKNKKYKRRNWNKKLSVSPVWVQIPWKQSK